MYCCSWTIVLTHFSRPCRMLVSQGKVPVPLEGQPKNDQRARFAYKQIEFLREQRLASE